MRCLLLLLLGLVIPRQSCCFEFVIDGEWEDDDVSAAQSHQEHRERHKRATLTSEEQEDFGAITGQDITVKSYKVESRITSRFAHVTVRSSVVNSGTKAQSIAFNVQIPKRAFISNFTMNVNGITFVGSVKEKTLARKLYARARSRNHAAGIVRTNSQDLEVFKTEVHVPPGSNIEFELHYQEMMERKLGFYEHSLYLQPGRLVPHFQVDVYIYEQNGIASVETSNTFGTQFAELIKVTSTKDKAHVVFKPSVQQQRECANCTNSAIDGELTVKYDVTRDSTSGELQVSDSYFFYFLAPSNLSPFPKNIVFVIDVSGSMWGVKMKQTVEAMRAILDDLTVEDQFGIIDFNHNVRCWNEDLVPGSSLHTTSAKSYIESIKPNGGTNINEALMRAVQMLMRAFNQDLINSRSISMIILVSDGDPTVGEIKLSVIQKNIKRAMREEFSLFSVGIGFDVDYDFLERIAMENRGMAQRIYANHDAAEQLRTFYHQVSSPLLSKIAVRFSDESVTNVTQSQFDKYFSGSELVVAGRVLPSESSSLSGYTSASSANMDLILEMDADIHKLDEELAKQQHSFTGFAKQMWAYLTIKQLIGERSLAPTAAKKRKITQRIISLSLDHQFVTPLTALLVTNDDDPTEMLLADSPMDPKHGCCSALPATSRVTFPPRPPGGMVYATPPSRPHWLLPATQPPTPSQVKKGEVDETLVTTNGVTRVDEDPHFIIRLPRSNMDVCFNIDSKPGHILNLVSDIGTGVVVNGQLISSKKVHKDKLKTYFGVVSVYYQPEGFSVTVSTDRITTTDGRRSNVFTWGSTAEITHDGVTVSIVKNAQATITINNRIQVTVLLHRVWKKHPVNVDFLGVYLSNSNQYSPLVHGLIGQFSQEPEVRVYGVHEGADPLKKEATMEVKGNKLLVTRGWQKDYTWDRKHGSNVYCWFIHNSGKGFIDGHYSDYIVPDLDSFLQLP
ncbi:inter-alpha-trypsin inhibitor heavy chain H2 [Kryptolebias marmoratus]|uniref:Inter-alpha-trypsin inhibitor heavy chain 2 n=1 Tax=Kryptolebias marmoratus TaxID=37003 RepID=A0A3Q3ASZ1_KRYMA|nr:inter-alpha-trypsin inhibitor heavy chain H2 [Kryptolebias marmoratus]